LTPSHRGPSVQVDIIYEAVTGEMPVRAHVGGRAPIGAVHLRSGGRVSGSGESIEAPGGIPQRAQGLLFGDVLPDLDMTTGYRGPTACRAAGITYRQLDYWARTGLVEPTVRPASGSGTQRLYSFRDILVLKVVKRLLDTGVSLQQIRTAVFHLRERGVDDLAQITLMSDGASVYECTSADEVIDLVQGGQGVFGIAVGRVWREVEGTLASLPTERVEDEAAAPVPSDDELSLRRQARSAG
jgi:DNA-binding transcriptional MerR regulator